MQEPTIGRIVIYRPTQEENYFLNIQNECNLSNELPAIIVRAWNTTCVNLRVFVDGKTQYDLWKTSVIQGDEQGQWNWPVKK